MKTSTLLMAAAAAAIAGTGCANVERSRDLSNPAVSGTTLALQVCSNCHGVTGNSVSPNFPNLAAQRPAYVEAQLKGFRSHSRADPAGFEYMWGLSRHLTDAQIASLASYFESQRLDPSLIARGDAGRLNAGETIFRGGLPDKGVAPCATCHGDDGLGRDEIPRIAGQHAEYLVKQLLVFQNTTDRPAGALMKVVVHELSPQDVQSVAAFAQSLAKR
jgi:cytochrome c553